MTEKVIIIGGGCAGLTAAVYCARALLKPIVFVGKFENKGGLLVKTSIVENFPGFPNGINGYDLIDNMEIQAVKYGAAIIESEITDVDFSKKPLRVIDSNNVEYLADTVIICTGSTPNRLGINNEDKFWSRGISSCAVCDGALYRSKNIMVVGGGDSAMEEALFLTKFSNVTLVHRRSDFRASKVMIERVLSNSKINIILDTVVESVDGDNVLKIVTIKNLITGEIKVCKVDGLFYGLGLSPNTKLFVDQLDVDDDGYIVRYHHPSGKYKTMTSIEGVFVAGDATDKRYRQAIVACGDGCKAALDVEKYLTE